MNLTLFSRKLEISPEELNKYLSMPIKSYRDYKNSVHLFNVGAKAMKDAWNGSFN